MFHRGIITVAAVFSSWQFIVASYHGKFETRIRQSRADPIFGFLDRSVRQPDDGDNCITPAGIDFHLNWEGLDSIDSNPA